MNDERRQNRSSQIQDDNQRLLVEAEVGVLDHDGRPLEEHHDYREDGLNYEDSLREAHSTNLDVPGIHLLHRFYISAGEDRAVYQVDDEVGAGDEGKCEHGDEEGDENWAASIVTVGGEEGERYAGKE